MKKRKLIDRLACQVLVSISSSLARNGYGTETDCCHGGAVLGDYVDGTAVDCVRFRYEGHSFTVCVCNNDPNICVTHDDSDARVWINDPLPGSIIKAAQGLIDSLTDKENTDGEHEAG